jgi:hypothetical protein
MKKLVAVTLFFLWVNLPHTVQRIRSGTRALPDILRWMSPPGAIFYLLVLPSTQAGEFSLFQGFSLNSFGVSHPLRHICTLPASFGELFVSREEVIRLRASGAGGYTIALLETEFLSQFSLPQRNSRPELIATMGSACFLPARTIAWPGPDRNAVLRPRFTRCDDTSADRFRHA